MVITRFCSRATAVTRILALSCGLALAGTAMAGMVEPTSDLPPLFGPMVMTAPFNACYTGPGGCLLNGLLTGFTNQVTTFDGSGQHSSADVTFSADVWDSASNLFVAPILLTGTIAIDYLGRFSQSDTGTFATQVTALSLTGGFETHSVLLTGTSGGLMGSTSITPDGGNYQIDSFFDVFTEVTLEDQFPLQPSPASGPQRFDLATPEPGTLSLLLVGMVPAALALRRRRRRA
jgi:hypothetical protein